MFGIFQREGRVYTEVVPDCRKKTPQNAIRGPVSLASVIHSDGWRGFPGATAWWMWATPGTLRVNHGEDQFARGSNHINGIESFWSYAKRRLTKFNGVPKHTFYLHLKETEFRFNHRRDNLYQALLRLLRQNPI